MSTPTSDRLRMDGFIHPQSRGGWTYPPASVTPVDGFIHPCLCPLRRSLPSQRIAPGQTRHTHAECTKRPNASQPRRCGRTHFVALHTHELAAESRPHTCRIPPICVEAPVLPETQARQTACPGRLSDALADCGQCAAMGTQPSSRARLGQVGSASPQSLRLSTSEGRVRPGVSL